MSQIQELLVEHCERFLEIETPRFDMLQQVRNKIAYLRTVVSSLGVDGKLAGSVLKWNDPASFESFLALSRVRLVLSRLSTVVRANFTDRGIINRFDPTLAQTQELAFNTIRDGM